MASSPEQDGSKPSAPSDSGDKGHDKNNASSSNLDAPTPLTNSTPSFPTPPARSSTTGSLASTATQRLRSVSQRLLDADLPPGFMTATGGSAARVHSLAEIRRGSLGTTFTTNGSGSSADISSSVLRRVDSDGPQGTDRRRLMRRTGTEVASGTAGENGESDNGGSLAVRGEGTDLETLGSATDESQAGTARKSSAKEAAQTREEEQPPVTEYANGYQAPPKLPWTTSTALALKAYGAWVLTVPGFLITIYGLNVVAWGGMLFLLLCNAAPAMCHPDCNDINSPRRVWIEIDSQILNALFCVTGFGLAPWRARDVWWWAVWRLGIGKAAWGPTRAHRRTYGLRRLAGINRAWFRLPGTEALPPTFPDRRGLQMKQGQGSRREEGTDERGEGGAEMAEPPFEVPPGVDEAVLPVPLSKTPDPPPTGERAPPTRLWKLDFVVWCNMWNTFLQACLAGFMWALNRFDRPSWSTGLFVALACIVAGMGGFCVFLEGKAVRQVEGVPMETWKKEEKIAMDEEKGAGGERRKENGAKGSEAAE